MKFSPGKSNCCDNLSPCTNSLCATFDHDWNRIDRVSGLYPVAPPYYQNYSPCCFEIEISGITGSGSICANCEDLNRLFFGGGLSISGDKIVFNYTLYGFDKFDTCTSSTQYVESLRGYKIIGDYNSSGIDCRNLEFDLDWEILDSPGFCDYSHVGGHVRGLYTQTNCRTSWSYGVGNAFEGCIHSSSVVIDLPINECVSVSGNQACYITDDCGTTSCVALSGFLYDLVGVKIPYFSLSGVVGYDDDVNPSGDTVQTCRKCTNLNRTWYYGDEIPTCCECSNSMCLTEFAVSMSTPTSYITLHSTHGVAAYWIADTPSGSCPTSPLHFIFSSGSSENWNRCDFSDSGIDLTITYQDYESSSVACGSNIALTESVCFGIGSKSCLVGSFGKPRSVVVNIPDDFAGPYVYGPIYGAPVELYDCGEVVPGYWVPSPFIPPGPPIWVPPVTITCYCQTKPATGSFLCEMDIQEGINGKRGFVDCPGSGEADPCVTNISPCLSGLYDCRWCEYTYVDDQSPIGGLTGCVAAMTHCGLSNCPTEVVTADPDSGTCIINYICNFILGWTNCSPYSSLICRVRPALTSGKVELSVTYSLSISCMNNAGALGGHTWSKSWGAEVTPDIVNYGECGDYYYQLPSGTYTLTTTPASSGSYTPYWPYQWAGASITVEIP